MVCSTCGTSILGRTIQGRSTAGYDYRNTNQYGLGQQQIGRGPVILNGVAHKPVSAPVRTASYNTSMAQPAKLNFDLGSLVIGGILGITFGYFIFAKTGRQIGYEAGKRVAGRIRG